MATELRGVLSAIATPFTEDGSQVDEVSLRKLVDFTIGGGIHGIVTCGGTGEFFSLTMEERKRVTEIVMDQVQGRAPVAAHTGSTSTAVAIELSKHAESVGADAVMAMQPFCEPLSLGEVYDYFKAISDAINVPIMIYNIPACTGMHLQPYFLARMGREIENVKYVKDSSGNLAVLSQLIYEYSDDITVFNGADTISFAVFAHGSKGGVWAAPNVMPEQCACLFDLCDAGKLSEARALWDKMWPVMKMLENDGFLAVVKAGAALMGIPIGKPRPPFRSLSPEKTRELKRLLIEASALKE